MMVKLFANFFWIYMPGFLQKKISRAFSIFFETKFSRLIIFPYILMFGITNDYLADFESESGTDTYKSYSDFFKRRYKMQPQVQGAQIWPCEGYVCDWGPMPELSERNIKGQSLAIESVFSTDHAAIKNHYYLNIFLHNHNYHRIHMPVTATINKIVKTPGNLNFLRPWFYKRDEVSYPAFKNERVSVEMQDEQLRLWILTFVGGFGVGTIELAKNALIGTKLDIGTELGLFKLGSTICLASPVEIDVQTYLQKTFVGREMKLKLISKGRDESDQRGGRNKDHGHAPEKSVDGGVRVAELS